LADFCNAPLQTPRRNVPAPNRPRRVGPAPNCPVAELAAPIRRCRIGGADLSHSVLLLPSLPFYGHCRVEHSNSRFKWIRLVMRIDSFCKKNQPFDSVVVMQFFLLTYCIVSAKNKLMSSFTPNLLFEYQCTSGRFIRLPNRIEQKAQLSPRDRAMRRVN